MSQRPDRGLGQRNAALPVPRSMVVPNRFGRGAPDMYARRLLGETLRDMVSAEDLGMILLSIAGGKDPWAEGRTPNPDGVPMPAIDERIDWTFRMQALKLFLEYHSGKPMQSVHIQATMHAENARLQPVPVGVTPELLGPATRDAFRTIALAALGELGEGAVDGAPGLDLSEASMQDLGQFDPAGRGVISVDGVERVHSAVVAQKQTEIKIEFVDSSNLYDAVLSGSICTVRFRAGLGGEPTRTYKYANVTPALMEAWKNAPSAGAWFAREIRKKTSQYPVIP